MRNKYGNKKTTVDGLVFASRAEAHRYAELRILERGAAIRDLVLQPEFLLQASFKKDGKTVRAVKYVADFQYFDNDTRKWVVEDVKGGNATKTAAYSIKKRLFEYKYPELTITEVEWGAAHATKRG